MLNFTSGLNVLQESNTHETGYEIYISRIIQCMAFLCIICNILLFEMQIEHILKQCVAHV
jgi:hypothetical protein